MYEDIENPMVIDSLWDDDQKDDAYDVYGDISNVIDCLFDEDKIHLVIESYLSVDDLEEKEEECQQIFYALEQSEKVYWRKLVNDWIIDNNDKVREIFCKWYADHHEPDYDDEEW